MSHIVKIQTEIRDPYGVITACWRLNLPPPKHGTIQLYSDSATGLAVNLPEWHYPVVCDTTTGQIHYDNFNGHWGKQRELDRFLQAYAVEKTLIEARKHGHTIIEEPLLDGSIRLTIHVAGGAA